VNQRTVKTMANRLAFSAKLSACALVCIGAVTTLPGCRGDRTAERPRQFFPDMDDQPKYKAQSQNPVFADGRSMRPPVIGVVAFGSSADANDPDRRWMTIDSDAVALGLTPDGGFVEYMPIRDILGVEPGQPINAADVDRFVKLGQKKYNIFCTPCHGVAGDGTGIVGQRWAVQPLPDYHDPRYLRGGDKGQDGLIFSTIRNGVVNTPGAKPALRMPAYGDRVSVEEAWAIVAYVRALQKTQQGELRDVPESVREGLLSSRGADKNNSANTATQGSTP